eukprot:SAG11_NODE_7151_length_1186_cov_1.182153_3_plen_89_part_01
MQSGSCHETTLNTESIQLSVLRQPDYTREFVLYTDACDYAIGGALTQKHDGKPCVVAYTSRSLLGPELNYSVQEKEALGIVHGVKKFQK